MKRKQIIRLKELWVYIDSCIDYHEYGMANALCRKDKFDFERRFGAHWAYEDIYNRLKPIVEELLNEETRTNNTKKLH